MRQTEALPCFLVHGEMGTESCEVNTLKRWLRGFEMSARIYLPVHAIPKLVFGIRPAPGTLKITGKGLPRRVFLAHEARTEQPWAP